ncbi:MAG: glycosyltransferase, partial [Planctomycetota bacterium]|nr:glycosyltransferase [Planctomycetota bacterium]
PETPARQNARSKSGRFRIGTVGRLSHEKGMDMLIEAFALVKAQLPQAELVLVGDGAERPRLEGMVAERGLTDSVCFLGIRDDVPALLAGFDIFVLPSRSEGLPLVILEAMAAGLPIVATDVGGVSEAVRDGENGLLIRPESSRVMADAIIKLAENEDMRNSLGQASRSSFNERFELSLMVNSYGKIMDIQ